ncbi:hypothetical protein D9758_006739 [Tetrapyrgos nigripes]|uniref:Uncharacterized protein n=1 Tax=Tetrapyrgos nigripes TaxID=182062 RepID=A0A8H5LQS7_9AGAR|nr:hypothetical protein D9758_006739 [Tetrapyrgos nigripes]
MLLADSGLKILTWAGDADIERVSNWLGHHAAALAMDWYGMERLAQTPFTKMTMVVDSKEKAPAYQSEVALEIFRQILDNEQLHSVSDCCGIVV